MNKMASTADIAGNDPPSLPAGAPLDSLACDGDLLRALAREHGTPYYLFDQPRFDSNVTRFRAALRAYHPAVELGYSFKTNYTPAICARALQLGAYAEVVSGLELELAERLGAESGRIIFNGPVKTVADLQRAARLDAIINFDGLDQIRSLWQLAPEQRQSVRAGLRVNVSLEGVDGESKVAKGGLLPRFGMSGTELLQAREELDRLGIPVIGLHGHASSSDRAPANYSRIGEQLLATATGLGLNALRFLNFGGGYSGRVPVVWGRVDAPSFEDYASAIFAPLIEDPWFRRVGPTVIIEPGMSVVADCMSLVTRILGIKQLGASTIATADASFYHVRPTLHLKPLTYFHHRRTDSQEKEFGSSLAHGEGREDGKSVAIRCLVGATCMERDILLENLQLTDPDVDDLILIDDVGAYCSVLSPNFIVANPPILAVDELRQTRVLRRRQAFEDFFASYHVGA